MKKIFLLLSIIGTFTFSSCTVNDDDGHDNDTISEVFIVDNVNFIASGDFQAIIPLNPKIYASDVILVYRWAGVNALGSDIWEPIPTSYSFDNGDELKYFFDYSVDDVVVYLESNFDPMLRQDFSLNQSIKIAIVPGYFSTTVDTSNHDAVMSALKDLNGGVSMPVEKIRL
ncbi:hypothetical protein OGH69_06075 [Flavobacterium sp. MFBS3-15]|uniref:hypothetical protein n=1 Tax=Flavobacterium sp. MFBS3-15 TaxID=2989816 RepID=UPI00223593DB|nr:hypothetical protein [Flavobacterium sp. MFBS3-15]MCW4468522.1 hypothetical protein [Flavobacterium sp. MFBS3-15]